MDESAPGASWFLPRPFAPDHDRQAGLRTATSPLNQSGTCAPFKATSQRRMNRKNCTSAINHNRTTAIRVNGFSAPVLSLQQCRHRHAEGPGEALEHGQ